MKQALEHLKERHQTYLLSVLIAVVGREEFRGEGLSKQQAAEVNTISHTNIAVHSIRPHAGAVPMTKVEHLDKTLFSLTRTVEDLRKTVNDLRVEVAKRRQ